MSSLTTFALVLATGVLLAGRQGVHAQDCSPDPAWLPVTPLPSYAKPAPHPAPDCPFYQAAWQTFLLVMQPNAEGRPAFLSYATIEDVFGGGAAREFAKKSTGSLSLAIRDQQGPNSATPAPPAIGAGIQQAGLRQVLIDQNGRPIYYAIHMNNEYVNFIKTNHLETADAVRNASPSLAFPKGVIELKSAWQIVDAGSPHPDYLTTKAQVPFLKIVDGNIVADRTNSREVTVALLAIHVVFAMEDHPELVWSTFEHAGLDGQPNVAPAARLNPDDMTNGVVISSMTFPLYKANTAVADGNQPITNPQFDEGSQTFKLSGTPLQTSIYRIFPASKSNAIVDDGDITSLNTRIASLFSAAGLDGDKRGKYRLVGAVWLDKTDSFKENKAFVNDESDPDIHEKGTDSPNSILGGEDRLSSTSMESFTQSISPHCFTCHDTRPVRRDLTGVLILKAKRLNVSHILSKFADEAQ